MALGEIESRKLAAAAQALAQMLQVEAAAAAEHVFPDRNEEQVTALSTVIAQACQLALLGLCRAHAANVPQENDRRLIYERALFSMSVNRMKDQALRSRYAPISQILFNKDSLDVPKP